MQEQGLGENPAIAAEPQSSRFRQIDLWAVLAAMAVAALLLVLATESQGQTLTVLHNFDLGNDGGLPYGGVALDQAGRIYGTTSDGGSFREGVVYRLVHQGGGWNLTPLYMFKGSPDAGVPYAPVVFGPDGALYGMTYYGGTFGAGTVFRLQPPASACQAALCPWIETVLYSFTGGSDGGYPGYGALVFDRAGNIYGTAAGGGTNSNGVVFKLTRSGNSWTQSVLWSFTGGADGANPYGGVIFDGAGNLYGTTAYGGQFWGTVYELSPAQSGWTETTLYTITEQDNGQAIGIAMDPHGNIFGLTGLDSGAAFELSPSGGNWNFTLMQTFTGAYEGPFDAPTLDPLGNVYGTSTFAGGNGEVFKLTPSNGGWIYTPLHDFDVNDGEIPIGGVTLDANGNLYGTTSMGGSRVWGTVWEITPN